MAQSGLRSFYPIRRRREDDTNITTKRRKLTENSHLEAPSANDEHLDTVTSDFSNGETSAIKAKKPTARSRKAGGRGTARKSQPGRGKRCKNGGATDVPNIKTLFEIINQTTSDDSETPPTTSTSIDNKLSDEYTLPFKCTSVASQSQKTTGSKPCPSPFKIPATPPDISRSQTTTTTPNSSPAKTATATALLPAVSLSPSSSPVPESRGARLLRMAKEKMATESPGSKRIISPTATTGSDDLSSSSTTVERRTRMAARRKLLATTNPDPPSATTSGSSKSTVARTTAKFFSSSKEQDRQEMVGELFKLSKRELTQPTKYEKAKVKRREGAAPSGSSNDGGGEQKGKVRENCARRPKLKEFGAFEFVSPTKNETAERRLPAYQKFHALARPAAPVTTPTPATPLPSATPPVELPLPYSYQLLEEKFRCTDTVVSMLQKRKEICTFEKLKAAVQEMSRRQFEEKNLGQMKTVYPTAFNFRQEKNIPGLFDKRNKYHLTVECRVEDEEQSIAAAGPKNYETKKITKGALNATTLIKRRKRFNQNLTEIAKKHHRAFLASLKPPLHIPDEKVLRWHPAFMLDSVPEVEAAPLPTPPIKETYTTAKDVLNVAQDRLAERVQAALASAGAGGGGESSGEAGDSGEGEKLLKRKEESGVANPELRGVSTTLLEKIKAKEAAKAKLAITRDPIKERQLEMLSRLPDFVRIVRGFFVTEKKAALPREDVIKKLVDSHPSRLPTDKVETHLNYLLEVLPEWIKSVKVSKGVFIKVDKKADLKLVIQKLETTKLIVSRQNHPR